jgi:hypothetical protein
LISLQKGGPWKGLHECVATMVSLLRLDWIILDLTDGLGGGSGKKKSRLIEVSVFFFLATFIYYLGIFVFRLFASMD